MQLIDLTIGMPFPEFFPSKYIASVTESLHRNNHYTDSLKYGSYIKGDPYLRGQISRLRCEYSDLSLDNIFITFGSTDAIDLFFRNTLLHGDIVVTENPTYKWAIKDIAKCGAKIVSIPMDKNGMKVELLQSKLERDESLAAKLKAVYTIPTFHNPTGISMSNDRRHLLVKLSKKYDFLILEDDPYYSFSYTNEKFRSLLDLDKDRQVIQICTFSKVMAPGLRLGWMATKNRVLEDICLYKYNASNPFLSAVVAELLKNEDYRTHLERCINYYAESLNIFKKLVENQSGGFQYFVPKGGFYIFLELPAGIEEIGFVDFCISQGVKVMPGSGFFCNKPRSASVRVSFTSVSHDDLKIACKVLNRALKSFK